MGFGRFLAVIALLLMTITVTSAQIGGGTITGTLRDEQGGVLPDSDVKISGGDLAATATTDAAGKFRFLNLAPGAYTLTATRSGFNTSVHERIEVRVGATADVAMTMKVAGVQEAISVTTAAQVPSADTRTTGTATNFTLSQLEKLPTSRDPFALLRTVPGVLLDRVNVGGNETGNQTNPVSKGTRPFDTVWTLDGVVVTDMVSTGNSPLYFNYDNFEEVQVTTAGQDIKQPTGGLGVNLVVRRGTDTFSGLVRGYFTNDSLEAVNVPDSLAAAGVTGETADHTQQITDYGFDLGGPIVRGKLWFFGSYSQQDIRLVRARLVDRTVIKSPNLKVNWQPTVRDRISFLYLDGDRVKNGRVPGGSGGIVLPAPTALQDQHNAYADNPFQGLWKIEENRTIGSKLFASGKFAYFNTGFELDPVGGLEATSGRSVRLGRSFGSVNWAWNLRPQLVANLDAMTFHVAGGTSHDVKFGLGWRRVDAESGTRWPGNGFLALDNSLADRRVRIFREGHGTNRVESLNFYAGDTIQRGRLTVDAGVRFDHQTAAALASQTSANPTFPSLVPGVDFAGFEVPFSWNTVSPRAGVTYALNDGHRTIVRASVSRYAGQMPISVPALPNPSTTVGFREYRWSDANGDQLATADEVLLDQFIQAGGGFNAGNPTAVTSVHQYDADLGAPVTLSAVGGIDQILTPDLVVRLHYSYTRSSNTIGNSLRRVGVSASDYAPGPPVAGRLPDGTAYSVATFVADLAAVQRGGGGLLIGNWAGYYSDYHGVEASIVKRLSSRWMGEASFALNNAREHYSPEGRYNMTGNPTPTDTEPLVDGGQYAPSPGGEIFLNSKWQFSAAGMYVAPKEIEIGVSLFGRQGYPNPPFVLAGLGVDAFRVLVSPEIDTYRLPSLWNTDLRIARAFQVARTKLQFQADLFNLWNANTTLVANRNAGSPAYGAIAMNLSPRILRLGLRVGF